MTAETFFPLTIQNLSLSFLKNKVEKKVLDDISLTLNENGITVIVGANGSGKTLLLKCLASLIRPTNGSLHWQQKPKPPQLTFVPQQPVLLDSSVSNNIRIPLRHNGVSDINKRCDEALSWANIHSLSHQPALTLSTGEQQLVALARAWALAPSILLLDEPIANLDPTRCQHINKLIQQLSLSCKIILTTHSIQQTRHLANDIIVLNEGQLLKHLDSHTFFNSDYAQHFEGSL